MTARRLVAVLLAAGCTAGAAGCGISPTGPISFAAAPRARLYAEQVYFVQDGRLHSVARSPATSPSVRDTPFPRAVVRVEGLDLLAAGPLPPEQDAGITTELPTGIRIFPAEQAGDELTLFLFGAEQPADPDQLSDLAVAQIACTATAARNVEAPVRRVTLRDKVSGHERGPVSCPVTVPERRG
ncbi:hypothetical protein HC031_19980 [Planosporangium thailandense]|uniref:GerMN domain-containing protein n=1 Tax=Planosporangium thailandense TaxID=765197 RepID=A0ABX0Y3K1_9ACTN|nr:hypothetical protein [Planosporangium thailandense]NJC71979.1 hypothetical protein [Planosporangium thailandense]